MSDYLTKYALLLKIIMIDVMNWIKIFGTLEKYQEQGLIRHLQIAAYLSLIFHNHFVI